MMIWLLLIQLVFVWLLAFIIYRLEKIIKRLRRQRNSLYESLYGVEYEMRFHP